MEQIDKVTGSVKAYRTKSVVSWEESEEPIIIILIVINFIYRALYKTCVTKCFTQTVIKVTIKIRTVQAMKGKAYNKIKQ